MIRATLATFVLFVSAVTCVAEPQSQIVPYPVDGRTAADVFTYIKTKSPRIAANATFAFTVPGFKVSAKSIQQNGGCVFTSYRTSLFFAYYIPQHANPKAMPAKTRKNWQQFVTYLEDHERLHGENWTRCLADYDRQVVKLKAKDCRSLGKTRDQLFETVKRACVANDEAIDVIFRKQVMQHPFLREAQIRN